jgi:hypothetical protein
MKVWNKPKNKIPIPVSKDDMKSAFLLPIESVILPMGMLVRTIER